jgi:hypothetical protein
MGARPIAALNSLRFGNIKEAKTQHLLKGVVSGIGHYGNCFGVPTVGGEIYFEDCYHTNPLVNAMSVGIMKAGDMAAMPAYCRHQGYSPKRSMLLVWENGSPSLVYEIQKGESPEVPVQF